MLLTKRSTYQHFFLSVLVAFFLSPFSLANASPGPKRLAVYYGFPGQINDAFANIDQAVAALSDYDLVVLGGSLIYPQYVNTLGQVPHFGCDQNSNLDHDNTVAVVGAINSGLGPTKIYGYVSIGGENTARICFGETIPTPWTLDEIKHRIDLWAEMGAVGVLLDESDFGFGVSRQRLNAVLDYLHTKNMHAIVNAFAPVEVFGSDLVGHIVYSSGALLGQTSVEEMNPVGEPLHIHKEDIYLLESYQITLGKAQTTADWLSRSMAVRDYQQQYEFKVGTIARDYVAVDDLRTCAEIYDSSKFDYVWWSTALDGFDYVGWGEANGYSSWGACTHKLTPKVWDFPAIGSRYVSPVLGKATDELIRRYTDEGVIELNVLTRKGSFTPYTEVTEAPSEEQAVQLTVEANTPLQFDLYSLLPELNGGLDTLVSQDQISYYGGRLEFVEGTSYLFTPADNHTGVDAVGYRWFDGLEVRSANFYIRVMPAQPEHELTLAYGPLALTVTKGSYDWGNEQSLATADTDTYDVKSKPLFHRHRGKVSWEAEIVVDQPLESIIKAELSYVGQFSRPNIMQTLSLFNRDTEQWDRVDRRRVDNQDDVTVVVEFTDDVASYVSEAGEVRIKLKGFSREFSRFFSWANYLALTVTSK